MRFRTLLIVAPSVLLLAFLLITRTRVEHRAAAATPTAADSEPKLLDSQQDRSPVDLVLARDGSWLLTVNQTSGTVSLVDVAAGSVLDEIAVGEHPAYAELHPDGKHVLVACAYSGELLKLEVAGKKLVRNSSIDVGFHPHGVAITADGKTGYVATTAADQVAVVDLEREAVVDRIDVGRWPRYLALSPDGKRLAVGTSGDRGVTVVDTIERKQLYLEQFVGLNIGHMQAASDNLHVYFPWIVYRRNAITAGNIRLGWVLASRLARIRLDGPARREAISLDPPGEAVADPHGLALTPDEKYVVVSASGSQELLVYSREDLPLKDYGGTDHLEPELLADKDRFFRIPLGGRPMGLDIAADNRTVYIANYLDNSVQVVDLQQRKIARTIDLGGPAAPPLVRRGEAIFYDGKRSLDQWYSCHSCHYEGGGNADVIDTLNDGSRNTFKTVLHLYNLDETPPWTWHGWQEDLGAAMRKSLTDTMLGRPPSDDDVEALAAYLSQLDPPPNPFRKPDGSLTEAALRGKEVFESEKAGCANCHNGPYFTDGQIHDVGLGDRSDRYDGFNTPSLIGVYSKVRLLHDGRPRTLEQVLTGPHDPDKVTGLGQLTDEQLQDLIAYLKSL
ncbi:MAG: c-type cytochrome [Pirellulaceae bacterium]